MKKNIAVLVSIILCVTILISSAISVYSYNIKETQNKISSNYYSDIDELKVFDSDFYINNAGILGGSLVNSKNFAKIYNSFYNFTLESNFNDFIIQYNSGKKLSAFIYDTGAFFTTVYDKTTESYSTAFMRSLNEKITVDAIYIDDNGSIFKIPEDKKIISSLSKECNTDSLDCKFVVLVGVTSGILVSDGKQELFIVTSPSKFFDFDYGTIFTADELVQKIIDNKDSIINDVLIFDINDDGETNYIIG